MIQIHAGLLIYVDKFITRNDLIVQFRMKSRVSTARILVMILKVSHAVFEHNLKLPDRIDILCTYIYILKHNIFHIEPNFIG